MVWQFARKTVVATRRLWIDSDFGMWTTGFEWCCRPFRLKGRESCCNLGSMQQHVSLLAAALSFVLSLTAACSSPSAQRTDSSLLDLAADTGAGRDSWQADAAPGTDAGPGADATRVLGDARTLAPDSRKCLPQWASSNHCQCVETAPSSNDLPECSALSVLSSDLELSICCEDPFGCTCSSYGCVSSRSLGTCECRLAGAPSFSTDSTAVRECPSTSSGQKCCLDDVAHTCVCSASNCLTRVKEVPSCSVADLATCASDANAWTSCK